MMPVMPALVPPMEGVHAHPPELQPLFPRLRHQFPRQVQFAACLDLVRRHAGPLAARRLLHPFVRQEQPCPRQSGPRAQHQRGKHAHLAVVDFDQPPVVLPGHPHGTLALLGEAAFVDPQA